MPSREQGVTQTILDMQEPQRLREENKQLREALIDAKVCIINYHDRAELAKVVKFLLKIDRVLGLDQTKPKE